MEYAAYIKRVLQHVQRQETKLSLSTLRIDIGGEVDPKRDRVVLVCIDSWISSDMKRIKRWKREKERREMRRRKMRWRM